jgi:hypothetical protein
MKGSDASSYGSAMRSAALVAVVSVVAGAVAVVLFIERNSGYSKPSPGKAVAVEKSIAPGPTSERGRVPRPKPRPDVGVVEALARA